MSLDKAIKSGKEKRKPYRKAKAVYSTCRNHGSCKWCEENRTHQKLKIKNFIKMEEKQYDKERNISKNKKNIN